MKMVSEEEDPKVLEKVGSLERNLERLDSSLATVRAAGQETLERIEAMEETLARLTRVYERMVEEVLPETTDAPATGKEDRGEAIEVTLPKEIPEAAPGEVTLRDIKNTPTSIIIMLRWLEFLLKRNGHEKLMDVLMYYEDIGWITANVRNRLVKYSRGVAPEDLLEVPDGQMEVEDHIISLFFVSKLKGIEISPRHYSSVIGKLEELGLLE